MTDNKSSQQLFRIRLAGLTGLGIILVGLILWASLDHWLPGVLVTLLGAGLLGFALVVEIKKLLEVVLSRRGAVGGNVALQVLLATLLVVGVNVFSFFHFARFDWTRDHIFTIPPDIRAQLSNLRDETTIVVLQRHASFGQSAENKLDNYDAAAQRQIVEKVKDLAEQFSQLGPRFRVELLDVQEEGFQKKLDEIKARAPALAEAIDQAPENSIFFASGDRVQRLSFRDIYQLDKQASRAEQNLVLNYQGVEPFARKILNVEEKKPRVALGVIHELLSLSDPREDRLTMNGAKKALESHGFETRDIILKKWSEMAPPESTAFTFDEHRFEGLEESRLELEESIKTLRKQVAEVAREEKIWRESSLEKLNQLFIYVRVNGGFRLADRDVYEKIKKSGRPIETSHVDDNDRKVELKNYQTVKGFLELNLESASKELATVQKEQKTLNVDNLAEQRRIQDVRAKLTRLLADCDLLILPRHTLLDIPQRDVISNRVHGLEQAQFQAVKDFLKSGRPVLFCLGPNQDSPQSFEPPDMSRDGIEDMLAELGFKLPKQTILHNVETKAFGERRGNLIISATKVEAPAVMFEWPGSIGLPGKAKAKSPDTHPIRESLELTSRSLAKSPALDLRLRYPRPVYFEPPAGKSTLDVTLMMASPESWNEDNPFPTRERTPRFEPPKRDDPDLGTVKERRRGPFPIAAAVEAELPANWFFGDKAPRPPKVRLAVLGNGGVFVGKTLTPIQEKLLLDVSNWLLGRDDLLARSSAEPWSFPRVDLSDAQKALWVWGMRLGLPLVFIYIGLVVWLVRRMR